MGKTLLPKGYISYSQYTLWNTNKDAYRQRYYEDYKYFETPETKFGKEIAERLETEDIKGVKRFMYPEYKIVIEYKGYKILGYLDSFCPRWKKFLEYKTSRKDVKAKWNQAMVQKHKQLDFYSFMVQKLHGKVHNECELIVLETTDRMKYKGREVRCPLRLTGKVTTYKRKIDQWERDFIAKDIIRTCKEIEEDYKKHLELKEKDLPF